MPKGGKRPGAGRPKGSESQSTKDERAIREEAAEKGVTPATILLSIARFHYGRVLTLRRSKPRTPQKKAEKEIALKAAESVAIDAATKAAPYFHPKLATLQSNVNLEGRLTLEDLVRASLPQPANNNAALPAPVEDDVDKTAAE